MAVTDVAASERSGFVRTAFHLEAISIVWMAIEGAAAIGAGIVARSLLLVAFGIDSIIELASAIVVLKRFWNEAKGNSKQIDRKTARVAGYLLLLLSIYVVVQAIIGLVTRQSADRSLVGIAVAVVAAIGMPFLAKAKLRVADRIDSRALRADAMETLTCGYLSWILLVGLALNATTHWWWIDSVASLAIVPLLVREGWEAMSSKENC